jgi:hypothetical protein
MLPACSRVGNSPPEEARVLGRGCRHCCGLHRVALHVFWCAQAGGGVFFDSAAGTSSVSIVGCTISNNFVDYALAGNSHDGLGGALAPKDASMALRCPGVCSHMRAMHRWHLHQPLQLCPEQSVPERQCRLLRRWALCRHRCDQQRHARQLDILGQRRDAWCVPGCAA